MADIILNKKFSPAEATRGQYAPIVMSTMTETYPPTGRGRYANLTYIVGSEAGALNLALSGGTVILPVSAVNISEPVTIEKPDTTSYGSVSIAPTSVATVNFAPNATVIELYNNDTALPVYVHFNSSVIGTVSAQGLPLLAESFYSIDRSTATLYIGNTNSSNSIDVRVIGHYTA